MVLLCLTLALLAVLAHETRAEEPTEITWRYIMANKFKFKQTYESNDLKEAWTLVKSYWAIGIMIQGGIAFIQLLGQILI